MAKRKAKAAAKGAKRAKAKASKPRRVHRQKPGEAARSKPSGQDERRRRFVEQYVIHFNAARAAREAGFSVRSASTLGERLLREPAIQEAVVRARSAQSKRAKMTADEVIEELSDVARMETRNGTKVRALEVMARHHGLLNDKLKLANDPESPLTPLVVVLPDNGRG